MHEARLPVWRGVHVIDDNQAHPKLFHNAMLFRPN